MSQQSATMQSVKIATWNVAYGINRSKNVRILEEMERVDADIWVLTETHDDLRPPTPGNWKPITSDDRPREARDIKEGSRWSTIWSRLPIIETLRPDYDPVRSTAGIFETPLGNLLVFGTVLPWYQDHGRSVVQEIAQQSEDWSKMLNSRRDLSLCIAGDFNVNLGGPHYYGAEESKESVRRALTESGLVALTEFENTGPVQSGEFGLIDHIAISESFASMASSPQVWQRENSRGEVMSDHCGVAVELIERFSGSGFSANGSAH